jgi:xanthine/uracil permease
MIFLTFLAHRFLTGIWKSTLVLWSLVAGWLAFLVLFGPSVNGLDIQSWGVVSPGYPGIDFAFDPAVIISFIMCFLALSVNDLGSIQAVGEIIKPSGMRERITRGLTVTGLGNILSGLMGVIGPVNFSGSPGMIISTRCASRFTLIPAAVGLLIASFLPALMGFIAMIPSVVIGVVLIYIMSIQLATGLLVAFGSEDRPSMDSLLVIGLPVLLATMIAYLPASVINTFPVALRPLLGNGFVVGLVAALFLEHMVVHE